MIAIPDELRPGMPVQEQKALLDRVRMIVKVTFIVNYLRMAPDSRLSPFGEDRNVQEYKI